MGGWVVLRSRFWDFDGQYVHHCHILQLEGDLDVRGMLGLSAEVRAFSIGRISDHRLRSR